MLTNVMGDMTQTSKAAETQMTAMVQGQGSLIDVVTAVSSPAPDVTEIVCRLEGEVEADGAGHRISSEEADDGEAGGGRQKAHRGCRYDNPPGPGFQRINGEDRLFSGPASSPHRSGRSPWRRHC